MASYAFWNNKGGVGKSFLCFIAACEYAHKYPESDVYVIDLCPQANVSETLLGGYLKGAEGILKLINKVPRATIAGYLDARLSSPFRRLEDVDPFVSRPYQFNTAIPKNLALVCGDNLLEVQSEAIRQTSQLMVPVDAWKQVLSWITDLTAALRAKSGQRAPVFFIDCNPSFTIFTQLAVVAAEHLVVPFTADESSRRALQNVVTLLYGFGDVTAAAYARFSFAQKAKDEGVNVPKLHTFVSNRVTKYEGKPSKAFEAIIRAMKKTVDDLHARHREIFSDPKAKPSDAFLFVPDYHSASVVITTNGIPLHKLTPGPQKLIDEKPQLNQEPLEEYRKKLIEVVDRL
jgi:cellulose biosynthesis protein BcsQ